MHVFPPPSTPPPEPYPPQFLELHRKRTLPVGSTCWRMECSCGWVAYPYKSRRELQRMFDAHLAPAYVFWKEGHNVH
jgi:hypothetical protein